jgi:hypothetical protein
LCRCRREKSEFGEYAIVRNVLAISSYEIQAFASKMETCKQEESSNIGIVAEHVSLHSLIIVEIRKCLLYIVVCGYVDSNRKEVILALLRIMYRQLCVRQGPSEKTSTSSVIAETV